MSRVLAFDTSTEAASIALAVPAGVFTRDLNGEVKASARLIPDILALLAEAGETLASLDAIAFGCGPGAFTGLRTACSVAQGLAFGAGKPVVPVDSLMLVAEGAWAESGQPDMVWVAMDARMDEIYAAAYRRSGARWSTQSRPALYPVEALNRLWQSEPPQAVTGSAPAVFGERLQLGDARLLAEPVSRARALAAVACQSWSEGLAVDAALALPVYLRDKVAQTTLEREALRAAKVSP